MIPFVAVLEIAKAIIPAVVKQDRVAAKIQEKIAEMPDVVAVPDAVIDALPAPKAMEALWPQLLRYGISIAGTVLAHQGIVSQGDWEIIAGSVMAVGPPLYRVITTLIARYKAR